MKVLGITGSSRHNMNTGTLVAKILEGAQGQGAQVQHLYLGDYHLEPCKACEACKTTQRCVINDDMSLFHEALSGAQALVLGTPIYFDHVSAQLKLFLDRLYPFCGPNMENYFPPLQLAVVATWADSNPNLYDGVISWLSERFSCYYQVNTLGTLKAANTGAVFTGDRKELLQAGLALGVKLVRGK